MEFYASNANRDEICGRCVENKQLCQKIGQLKQEIKSLQKLVNHYEYALKEISAYKRTINLKEGPPPMRIVTMLLKAEEALKVGEVMKTVDSYLLERRKRERI
jgi:hypothetical protein